LGVQVVFQENVAARQLEYSPLKSMSCTATLGKRTAQSSVVRIVLPVKIGGELQATGHFRTSKVG